MSILQQIRVATFNYAIVLVVRCPMIPTPTLQGHPSNHAGCECNPISTSCGNSQPCDRNRSDETSIRTPRDVDPISRAKFICQPQARAVSLNPATRTAVLAHLILTRISCGFEAISRAAYVYRVQAHVPAHNLAIIMNEQCANRGGDMQVGVYRLSV